MTGKKQSSTPDKDINDKIVIAVIDDEHQWLKIYKRLFRNSNYCVESFSDPQVFLDTIAIYPNRFGGIICDIKMPVLSGHKVFEIIKENESTRNIPFLIVSGVLTQQQNLSQVQTSGYVSKLDDDLRTRIFEELIEVIENWPKVKQYLKEQNVAKDKIDFFCQFYINYQEFFNKILTYINRMEEACVASDKKVMDQITKQCTNFMEDLNDKCMSVISLMQESPGKKSFIRKICTRCRSSLNMILNFQIILTEETASNMEFQSFLKECRESLEKIIAGTENGYNLRKD